MKWRILTIAVFLTPVFLQAQPTIMRLADLGAVVASQPVTDDVEAGSAGENVEWDFSAVTPDTAVSSWRFVSADTTAYANQYPDANICLFQEEFDIYNYLYVDQNTMVDHGIAFSVQQQVYSDPKTILTFPFTYGSSFSDDYASMRLISGFTYHARGSVEADGDAYGTLHLPGQTFPDVLRVKTVDIGRDSADLGSGYIEVLLNEDVTYTWYNADHPAPLAVHSTTSQTQIGILVTPDTLIADTMQFAPETTFAFDPTAVYSGTRTFEPTAFDLDITPNPFSKDLTVIFNADKPQDFVFELRSLAGETITQTEIKGVAGENQLHVNPGSLPGGTYVAILRGESLATTRKVVRWE